MSFEAAEVVRNDRESADIYRHAMQKIVEEVFHVMLGAGVRFCGAEPVLETDAISSYVGFQGSVDAAMWLRCSVRGAEMIAGLFMGGMRPASAEELDDAMREMANIVAGNLRKLMPHGVKIGAPAVHRGNQGFIGEMIFSRIIQTCFELNGDVISLNFGLGAESSADWSNAA